MLFIDEAYQLSERERGGFGQEAIGSLLTRMENDRDHLVVIVAGYSEKMKEFRKTNPGLPLRATCWGRPSMSGGTSPSVKVNSPFSSSLVVIRSAN